MSIRPTILRVAIPSPLYTLFDYLAPTSGVHVAAGQRVSVSFGRRQTIGLVMAVTDQSEWALERLKAVKHVLDERPLYSEDELAFFSWIAGYYHVAIGELIQTALPSALLQGRPLDGLGVHAWLLTAEGHALSLDVLKRAKRQRQLFDVLKVASGPLTTRQLSVGGEPADVSDGWNAAPVLRIMQQRGWVERVRLPCLQAAASQVCNETPPQLNEQQQAAVDAVQSQLGEYACFLLDGITGSGKTEVYLRLIESVLEGDQQSLVLVPEIGLTPQLQDRFRRRLNTSVAVLHSAMSVAERLCVWKMARSGELKVIIGTRSALFLPLRNPGLLIVDEEHDASLKQQEGVRYHARDLLVARARRLHCPVVLGSATPSLESIYNVERKRYRQLILSQRAGEAVAPTLRLVDVRNRKREGGLSAPAIESIRERLKQDEQVLLFINRRGYAPTLSCHQCGWVAACESCDSTLVVHQAERRLRCHHCGHERRLLPHCPVCESTEMETAGSGTERLEVVLSELFPETSILRIDRDTTRKVGSLPKLLKQAHAGDAGILIGTQMLAKGHHFPNVTLAVLIDVDSGLFSADFRATERLAQLLVQVAGRSGRAGKRGEVLIQTHHPDHPVLLNLIQQGYADFAHQQLDERRAVGFPPYGYLAVLRADSPQAQQALSFLQQAAIQGQRFTNTEVQWLGPVPAMMERRAGRHRALLMISAQQRSELHRLLAAWVPELSAIPGARKLRWSIDVDPLETM